jgi:hypothetical protein
MGEMGHGELDDCGRKAHDNLAADSESLKPDTPLLTFQPFITTDLAQDRPWMAAPGAFLLSGGASPGTTGFSTIPHHKGGFALRVYAFVEETNLCLSESDSMTFGRKHRRWSLSM